MRAFLILTVGLFISLAGLRAQLPFPLEQLLRNELTHTDIAFAPDFELVVDTLMFVASEQPGTTGFVYTDGREAAAVLNRIFATVPVGITDLRFLDTILTLTGTRRWQLEFRSGTETYVSQWMFGPDGKSLQHVAFSRLPAERSEQPRVIRCKW